MLTRCILPVNATPTLRSSCLNLTTFETGAPSASICTPNHVAARPWMPPSRQVRSPFRAKSHCCKKRTATNKQVSCCISPFSDQPFRRHPETTARPARAGGRGFTVDGSKGRQRRSDLSYKNFRLQLGRRHKNPRTTSRQDTHSSGAIVRASWQASAGRHHARTT